MMDVWTVERKSPTIFFKKVRSKSEIGGPPPSTLGHALPGFLFIPSGSLCLIPNHPHIHDGTSRGPVFPPSPPLDPTHPESSAGPHHSLPPPPGPSTARAYLLDREQQTQAKVMSNMVKQKRKEKAGLDLNSAPNIPRLQLKECTTKPGVWSSD